MWRAKTRLIGALGAALALCSLEGCSTQAPPLTKEEAAGFSGGPMPQNARQIVQQKMQEAREKSRQRAAQQGAPR
jgi:hypothetical protein